MTPPGRPLFSGGKAARPGARLQGRPSTVEERTRPLTPPPPPPIPPPTPSPVQKTPPVLLSHSRRNCLKSLGLGAPAPWLRVTEPDGPECGEASASFFRHPTEGIVQIQEKGVSNTWTSHWDVSQAGEGNPPGTATTRSQSRVVYTAPGKGSFAVKQPAPRSQWNYKLGHATDYTSTTERDFLRPPLPEAPEMSEEGARPGPSSTVPLFLGEPWLENRTHMQLQYAPKKRDPEAKPIVPIGSVPITTSTARITGGSSRPGTQMAAPFSSTNARYFVDHHVTEPGRTTPLPLRNESKVRLTHGPLTAAATRYCRGTGGGGGAGAPAAKGGRPTHSAALRALRTKQELYDKYRSLYEERTRRRAQQA